MVRRKANARSINSSQTARNDKSRTHVLVDRRKIRKTQILREIRYLRKSVRLLIPKLAFARVVKEIIIDLFPRSDVSRVQASALEALQEAAEAYLVQFFEDCVLVSQHAKRVTLQIQDMILIRRLRGRDDIINK